MKEYCTQNNGNCSTCSLSNYGRDCHNNPIRGGKREGAGRKPTGKKDRYIRVTDEEYEMIKEYLKKLRENHENS